MHLCQYFLLASVLSTPLLLQSEASLLDPLFKFLPPKTFMYLVENWYRVAGRQGAEIKNGYKRQTRFPDDMPFPCDVSIGRSPKRPISVHALRPGDIDVIATMGDSLSAGFGAKAIDIFRLTIANRGVSFSIGGEESWRTALTLGNVLKEFNPALVGTSTGTALSWQQPAELNVAEGFATVQDMPHQALLLIKRMKEDPKVDFENDWKVITILIGYNDICTAMCTQNLTKFFDDETTFLIAALDILHDRMPRLLVNVIPVANLIDTFDQFTSKPILCGEVFHNSECSCIGLNKYAFANHKQEQSATIEAISQFTEDIMKTDRYKDKDDFAVVVQPFTKQLTLPTRLSVKSRKNITDYSYFSTDCFHFSQKGHALAGNALWNNMMEPVGRKTRDWQPDVMSRFLCPSREHPYIYTASNSPGA